MFLAAGIAASNHKQRGEEMKRYSVSQKYGFHDMEPNADGEWIRYSDHCEAMKRIAGDGWQAEPVALTEDQIAVRAGIPFVGLSVKLVKALRRLSFAAQTSGGTAGRDDELMSAIQQAQEALEAAKGKGLEEVAAPAPSASPAALTDAPYRKLLAALVDIHDDAWDHAPEHRTYVEGAFKQTIDEARDLLAASPADQVEDARDAARYRWLRDDTIVTPDDQRCINVVMGRLPFRDDQKDEDLFGNELDEAIDAAMSASKENSNG